jgi:hypothetical protein
MHLTGKCYCGDVHYEAKGDPIFKVQCHCRECQYLSGGGPNFTIAMPEDGFKYTQGEPRHFTRSDLDNAVTREFCPRCGTQILTRAAGLPNAVLIKVGTLDDPDMFGSPDMAIFTVDMQGFHHLPEGVPHFERMPH